LRKGHSEICVSLKGGADPGTEGVAQNVPGASFARPLVRVNLDGRDLCELRARIAAYEAAGVQHIMMASDLLRSAEPDNWDGIIEGVGRLVAEARAP
jgi:hypothetical protein